MLSTAYLSGERAVPMDDPVVSAVVPMFNEQDNVALLAKRLIDALESLNMPYEVLLVDDGSGDDTWTRVSEAASAYQCLRGLRLARNFGHQAALLAGLSRARGKAIVSLDGDLQHPPELIPKLVAAWRQGAAVVETTRQYSNETTWLKRHSSAVFYRFFSFMSEVPMEKGRSDFRLVDRAVLNEMLSFQQCDLFLRGVVSWLNFPSKTIDFVSDNRQHGESKYMEQDAALRPQRHPRVLHQTAAN